MTFIKAKNRHFHQKKGSNTDIFSETFSPTGTEFVNMVVCDKELLKIRPDVALTEGQGHNDLEERLNIEMIVTEGHNNYDCDWMTDCDRRSQGIDQRLLWHWV